jgi:transposase
MTLHPDVIGIDIAKLHLDIHDKQDGTTRRIANSAVATAELAAALAGRDCLVVFEATGHYDAALRHALAQAGVAHARVNPEQARHFARASGRKAKTDALDARMLADLGSRMELRRESAASPAREQLCRLTRRRDQLVAMRKQERVRLREEGNPAIAADLRAHLTWLDAAIVRAEQAITDLMRSEPELATAETLLRSAPGIGPVTAAVLIGQLPELGQTNARAIAALAGLAPYNNDSGAFRGKRSIRGGRSRVRLALYMAALSLSRGSSPLASFHLRLRNAGKPHKVALIATARKLLATLNAMVRSKTQFAKPA